jgi:hypothetical protein
MQNYLFEQNRHQFFVDGGDSRTMKNTYLWIVLIGLGFWGSYYFGELERWLSPLVWFLISVFVMISVLFQLSKGKMARYLVEIDSQKRSIKAIDQKTQQGLWEDNFEPERLYLSEIQIFIGAERYRYPALVYGDSPQDLVEDGVPYSSKVVLGFGEKDVLEKMKETLSS